MGALYRIDFPNGKSYVGITAKTVAQRFARHCRNSKEKKTLALSRALSKYGAENVQVVTLAIAEDWDALCLMEAKAIKAYGTKSPGGYNLTDGGEGLQGVVYRPEVVAEMSSRQLAIWQRPGYREKMAEMRTGKRQSEFTKQKRSVSVAKKWEDAGHRNAVSEAQKAAWQDPESRASRIASFKAASSRPDVVLSRSAGIKAAYQKPEVKKKLLDAWADPAHKEKMRAAMKAGWARKRAEKELLKLELDSNVSS